MVDSHVGYCVCRYGSISCFDPNGVDVRPWSGACREPAKGVNLAGGDVGFECCYYIG